MGQHCVAALAEFGVIVNGIDLEQPKRWSVPKAQDSLSKLLIGDIRQPGLLESAEIKRCRAILLVTNDETVNVTGAFAARRLNSKVRVIIRSTKQNLNELLKNQLGNFAAFEAAQLPATAIALAALGQETLGFFNLDGELLRVVKHPIHAHHSWCNQPVYKRHGSQRLVLSHMTDSSNPRQEFYGWDDDAIVKPGDVLVRLELSKAGTKSLFKEPVTEELKEFWQQVRFYLNWAFFRRKLLQFWQSTSERQIQRVAIVAFATVILLLSLGTILIELAHPDFTPEAAFYNAAIFLLGGFGDQLGGFQSRFPKPWWINLLGLSLTVAGTIFVGILYATLTDLVLSSRFEFSRRPPIPKQGHVVLVGLGRVGKSVAAILQALNQPLVGVMSSGDLEPNLLPKLPLVRGDLITSLEKVQLAKALSVIVATEDEITNLEIALMARAVNPATHLVIRTYDPGFTSSLAEILPEAKVVCAYALAAEAFAGAAFGESIISLFRLNKQTVLVTEYKITANDTLHGMLLAEVAYGYGVVPVLYHNPNEPAKLMPTLEMRLRTGDRLVVLATITGLQRIERGEVTPCRWGVRVEEALSEGAIFEGGNAIARICGCELSMARKFLESVPATFRLPLYRQQAQQLVRELNALQIKASLVVVKRVRAEILEIQPD